jgi:hypothetical protein
MGLIWGHLGVGLWPLLGDRLAAEMKITPLPKYTYILLAQSGAAEPFSRHAGELPPIESRSVLFQRDLAIGQRGFAPIPFASA